MAAQDPDEPFDLYAADGTPLGRSKPRREVHRDGDWHRSLHVWVVLEDERGLVLVFQRRSIDKDTWPGAVDVAVTGHYRAGETLAEALREAHEEIGLSLGPEDVVPLGVRWRAEDRGDIHDHEIQDVLAARTRRSLDSLYPARDEVDALIAVALPEAEILFEKTGRAHAMVWRTGAPAPEPAEITLDELVPAADGYYQVAFRSLVDWLEDRASVPWRLGAPLPTD